MTKGRFYIDDSGCIVFIVKEKAASARKAINMALEEVSYVILEKDAKK